MRLVDADALRERLTAATEWHDGVPTVEVIKGKFSEWDTTALTDYEKSLVGIVFSYTAQAIAADIRREMFDALDAAPSINCAAHNPFRLVPSKCPMCGEELVPYPCMDMAQDSYRDGILYGQQHPEWRADG